MSITASDRRALEAASAAGFHISQDLVDEDIYGELFCARIICTLDPNCAKPAQVLTKAVHAAHRLHPRMTVWLDARSPAVLTGYIGQVLDGLAGQKTRLIVTEGERASHPPGDLLETDLLAALAHCNGNTTIWHPLAEVSIQGSPSTAVDSASEA